MSQSHHTHIFLLGSGVSCAANLPNMQTISCSMISQVAGNEAKLLAVIKDMCGVIHCDGRDSYEDWFFVAYQIYQHGNGEFENPAILPLMERMRSSLGMENEGIKQTAEQLCMRITEVVRHQLASVESRPDDAFDGLAEVIKRRNDSTFPFFTLNHDNLLEVWLRRNGFDPYMGLERHTEFPTHERVRFSIKAFENARLSVIKLHGSLNWRRFRPRSNRNRKTADPFQGEFLGIRHADDSRLEQMDDDGRALIGTWNKVVHYSSPAFLPMFAQFQRCLHASNKLVICGYGFADKGINSLLIDWMYSCGNSHLIVVDPQPFHPSRCRRAIFDKVETWQDNGRLEIIERRIGANDMAWTEIMDVSHGR